MTLTINGHPFEDGDKVQLAQNQLNLHVLVIVMHLSNHILVQLTHSIISGSTYKKLTLIILNLMLVKQRLMLAHIHGQVPTLML